jgi:integral membrane sensor domain MASE1
MPFGLRHKEGNRTDYDWRYWVRIIGLTVLYAVPAKLGLMMDAVSGFATLVWPATGIALAALMLHGVSLWPAVFLGALSVNLWTGATPLVASGIAVGNTLEAVLATLALRSMGRPFLLDRVRNVAALIGLAAALSTMVSATIGVASLFLGGLVAPPRVIETWRAWWIGDAQGMSATRACQAPQRSGALVADDARRDAPRLLQAGR